MPANRYTIPAPTLAIIVVAVMGALYGIDKFLAVQEQNELRQEAFNHYTAGQQLLHAGKTSQAVDEFARAHSVERTNREYILALAEAQLADRRLPAATDTLNDALEKDSNDGRANLIMARVQAAEDQFKEADSYYHRAIYGEWPANATAEPGKVRLELAKMLADQGRSQELLSELLLLQNLPNQDIVTEKQVAQLFLQARAGQRAEEAYRHLIQENPNDVDAFLGLGQAGILAGDYRSAENAVIGALRRRPYDTGIQSQLRLVANLASLDPTSRRLSSAEKYRRSEEIYERVQAELSACSPSAESAKVEKNQGPVTNEIAEARLDQAESLWKQRMEACRQPPAPDDPLPLLMKKLAQ